MNFLVQSLVMFIIVGANGFLALSEMALVSARKPRLHKLAGEGHKGASIAIALSESPTRFLASVQVCITILGIAAGAWGVVNLSNDVESFLNESAPALKSYSHNISMGIVVAIETFLMVLLGELLPKRIALFFPEHIAVAVAPIIRTVGDFVGPVATFLSRVTDTMIQMLPGTRHIKTQASVTEDEIKIMVQQGAEAGVFNKSEESMLKRALHFGDLTGVDLMTPRTRIVSINVEDSIATAIDHMLEAGYSSFPVYRGNRDTIVGVASLKKILMSIYRGQTLSLEELMSPPAFLPEGAKATRIIETMKKDQQHFVVLIDEFGGVAGIVTANDLMESVVGEVPGGHQGDAPQFVQRIDGSWLVDGMVSLYQLEDEIGFEATEAVAEDCQTLSGLVMRYLETIPREGQFFEMPGWRFEVVDMDHNRIDKVLISRTIEMPSDVTGTPAHENTHS